jgi:hypothetical protein
MTCAVPRGMCQCVGRYISFDERTFVEREDMYLLFYLNLLYYRRRSAPGDRLRYGLRTILM